MIFLEKSFKNAGEATIVSVLLKVLDKTGIPPSKIAIISPYKGQVSELNSIIPKDRENRPIYNCNSVDGFQGGENEVVILSLVRSNSKKQIGFLQDERRLNVAVSRARRCCIVIGDRQTIQTAPYIKNMMKYLDQSGHKILMRSLIQLPDWKRSALETREISIRLYFRLLDCPEFPLSQ